MTFGVPVVATRVGGNHEIMEHLVSGLLVEPGDPKRIADGVYDVLSDPLLKQALIAAGQRRVREAFAFETRMRREESFYDEALRRFEGGKHTEPQVQSVP
jgi:glycosyltransferase involved in cell wall biosynthesis